MLIAPPRHNSIHPSIHPPLPSRKTMGGGGGGGGGGAGEKDKRKEKIEKSRKKRPISLSVRQLGQRRGHHLLRLLRLLGLVALLRRGTVLRRAVDGCGDLRV